MSAIQSEAGRTPEASRPGVWNARQPSPAAALTLAIVSSLLLLTAAAFKIAAFVNESAAAAGARETMGSDAAGPAWYTLLLPIAEIVIAFGILWFRKRAWLWVLASILFGSFAGYTFLLMVRGEATCGCFGDYGPPPWVMFTVDTILAVLCAMLASGAWGYVNRRGSILTLAGAGALLGAGYANASTQAPIDQLDPVARLMQLPVMSGPMSRNRDARTWLVYIYAETCPRCQQHYPGMKRYVDATASDPDMGGLLLEVDDIAQLAEAAGVELPRYAWTETPTTLIMSGGRVIERFGAHNTPEPSAVFERYTSRSYEELLASAPAARPQPAPEPTPAQAQAAGDRRADVVRALREVAGEGGERRFAEIFNDAPGGTRHLLYAHTNCAACLELRRDMLELQQMDMLEGLELHFVAIELLEDDGVAPASWGGVHAALLFDGGELQRWYGEGEVTADLPVDIVFEE